MMNPSGIESEYSFVRTPFQEFSDLFKRNKRTLEKEISFFTSQLKTMSKNRGNLDRVQVRATIEALRNRLKTTVEALKEGYEKEDQALTICDVRVTHIANPEDFPRTRIRRMLVDYLQREGFFDLAHTVAVHMNVEELTDVRLFAETHAISELILKKDCDSALKWCDLHKSRLNKLGSGLEFGLKLQKFLELVKERNIMGAIRYARAHFYLYPEHLKEIQRAMVLLAIHTQPQIFSEYQDLLSEERWQHLAKLFSTEMLRVYSLPTDSVLSIYLHAGLTALKTPMCREVRHSRCPVCSDLYAQMAAELPLTSHPNSTLMCRIMDTPMNEHNPPMALPNGQTYSLQGLESIAKDRKVEDPTTHEVFPLRELKKVYTV